MERGSVAVWAVFVEGGDEKKEENNIDVISEGHPQATGIGAVPLCTGHQDYLVPASTLPCRPKRAQHHPTPNSQLLRLIEVRGASS